MDQDGGAASGQSVEDGPRRLQDGLGQPKMISKVAQDGFQYAPRGPKTGPTRLQVATEPPKEAPQEAKAFQKPTKIMFFCFLAILLPMAIQGLKMAPRWPKRAPREAQESPKTALRAPKSAPRRVQEVILGAPEGRR